MGQAQMPEAKPALVQTQEAETPEGQPADRVEGDAGFLDAFRGHDWPLYDKAISTDRPTDGSECVDDLVASYTRDGFCVIRPCVPAELTEALLAKITGLASRLQDNRGGGRVCLNSHDNIRDRERLHVLEWLVGEQSPAAQVMNRIFGDAWWFDLCGGDVIRGQAGFGRPCLPHSDWKGVRDGMIVMSVFLHDVSSDNAPLMLWSRSDGKCFTGAGQKGSILLRCVDTIHSGSPNQVTRDRVLPAFRFFTPAVLRQGWTPRGFLTDEDVATLSATLSAKCIFLRMTPDPDESQTQ